MMPAKWVSDIPWTLAMVNPADVTVEDNGGGTWSHTWTNPSTASPIEQLRQLDNLRFGPIKEAYYDTWFPAIKKHIRTYRISRHMPRPHVVQLRQQARMRRIRRGL